MSRKVGQLLVDRGVVDAAVVQSVLTKPGRLLSKLYAEGLAEESALVEVLALRHGLPGVDLSHTVLNLAALSLIPRSVALENRVLALEADDARLVVAVSDVNDHSALDELRFVTGREVVPHVALLRPLLETISKAYDAAAAGRAHLAGRRIADDRAGVPVIAAVVPDAELLEAEPIEVIVDSLGDEDEPLVTIPVVTGEALATQRVLVVDDEEAICLLLRNALEARGYQVEIAMRGNEALQKVQSFRPHILLLDAMLPEIHGFEICRKVKSARQFSTMPVLMMSAVYRGWRFAQDVKESYGADAYLEKPFRLEEVVRTVAELLAGRPPQEAPSARSDEAYRRGVELFKARNFQDARAVFEQSVREEPFSAKLLIALARCAQEQGDDYGAIAAFERALELRPDSLDALRTLGALYMKKGFRRKATEVWERALPLAPDDPSRKQIRERLLSML